jgi:predicted TIM-barrel fold metal-dependent hydrolase
MYWLIDIPAIFANLGAMAVGSTKVEYPEEEDGEPTIQARGIIFPVLAQEMNKGVAELLSHHGLADLDEPTTGTVLRHADDIKHEPYLMQVGPEMWRRFLKVKPRELPLSDLYMALSKQEPDELHKIIAAAIEDPENAKAMLSELVEEPNEFDIEQWTPESEGDEDNEDWR